MHWLHSEGKLRFFLLVCSVMGEDICVSRELRQVTLLCLSRLHVTCRCRTGAQLCCTCVVLCRQDSCTSLAPGGAKHRHVGSSGLSTVSHTSVRVPWTLQGLLSEGILSKCSMRSLAAGACGFPRDVWMLLGAPRT